MHGELTQLDGFPHVFFVRGRMPATSARPWFERALVYCSRTMTVVREPSSAAGDLVLLNTVRLDEQGLSALNALGEVRHVVRLGQFHGSDDAFFLRAYPHADYWHVAGMQPAKGLAIDPKVLAPGNVPIAGARVHEFRGANFPEAVLVLPRSKERSVGVAITCDSVQNHPSAFDEHNSWAVSFGIWKLGLP